MPAAGVYPPHHARRTAEAASYLGPLGQTVGGEAGACLAHAAGLPVSPATVLWLLRHYLPRGVGQPRVLGVDDLALRRGHTYATLLLALETHRPVDLVAGRDAATLSRWLTACAGIETIVRDRSEAYAAGARAGAPQAQQVSDRFHLVHKANAALDALLRGRPRAINRSPPASPPASPAASVDPPPLSPSTQQRAVRRAARSARWEQVRALWAPGASLGAIARTVGIERHTVRRLLNTPEAPQSTHYQHPRPGNLTSPLLQPYTAYRQDRWQSGCTNICQLYREITARGYPGRRTLLSTTLQPWRPPRAPPGSRRRRIRYPLRWLGLRSPTDLTPDEHAALESMLATDPVLAPGYALTQRFRPLVAARDLAALATWLAAARASGLPPFAALANGLDADRGAVEAAFRLPWSNGPTEGMVNKIKLIKRQGHGRAKFNLLRLRVLAS